MNVYLIGLPGSGKSTLGRELAKLIHFTLVDLDTEIIQKEGKSIETIFKDSGENYFRQREQEVLQNLSQKDRQLISTGGGTPCFFNNMEYINKNGVSLFIDVPIETLQQRLIGQRTQNRPLLEGKTDEDILLFLKQKYVERIPFYSKATITIKGSNIKAKELFLELQKIKLT
ncbi:MAG TPA: shikimate kinase [Cytophagaceae bacterium]|jgi:shikimate kinase|nr:shikimate kinase [Cytophagaceae bacterium]